MRHSDLEQIIKDFPDSAHQCAKDLAEHILEAAGQALIQSQDDDGGGKPKVAVTFRLTIDLSKSRPAWDVKAAVGVKYQAESGTTVLDDPSQPMLDFVTGLAAQPEGTTTTINAGATELVIKGKGKKSS